MARISNGVVTGLNVFALLLAISALGFSLWFHVKPESSCQRVLKTPLLVFGAALLVVSAAGLVGACCRVSFILWLYLFMLFLLIVALISLTVFTILVTNKRFILWLYLFMLFLLIVALISLTVFTILVTNKRVGKAVSNNRLGDYSKWLQKYVVNAQNWDEIKSCLVGVKLCHIIDEGKSEEYYRRNMPPVLSGCCKPPVYCGLQFHNATYWTMPKTGPAVPDPDCKTWSNGQEELCFDCYSCKKAVLDNIRREWRMLALINIAIIVFVIIVYSVGCCALRNNSHGYQKQQSGRA